MALEKQKKQESTCTNLFGTSEKSKSKKKTQRLLLILKSLKVGRRVNKFKAAK